MHPPHYASKQIPQNMKCKALKGQLTALTHGVDDHRVPSRPLCGPIVDCKMPGSHACPARKSKSVTSLSSIVLRAQSAASSSLLGSMEETILRGRVEPVQLVKDFRLEFGAAGTRGRRGDFFCPDHRTIPAVANFYSFESPISPRMSSAYMTRVDLGTKGYEVPRKGQVQVTLFNPHGTVVKMFLIAYDLTDMPPNCESFLRQRVYYMPQDANTEHPHLRKWLRYLIHLRFRSSRKKDKVYIYSDCRVLVFCKSDSDAYIGHAKSGNDSDKTPKVSSSSTEPKKRSPEDEETGQQCHRPQKPVFIFSSPPSLVSPSLPLLSPILPTSPPLKPLVWCMKSFTEHPENPRYSPL